MSSDVEYDQVLPEQLVFSKEGLVRTVDNLVQLRVQSIRYGKAAQDYIIGFYTIGNSFRGKIPGIPRYKDEKDEEKHNELLNKGWELYSEVRLIAGILDSVCPTEDRWMATIDSRSLQLIQQENGDTVEMAI